MTEDQDKPGVTRRRVLAGLGATIAAAAVPGGPAVAGTLPPASARHRERTLLDGGWRYAAGDRPDGSDPRAKDGGWVDVTVPHTWNAADSIDDEPGYRRGVGWYRRRIAVEPRQRNKRLFLYFEGANQVADVYVEGQRVGKHVGGYTAFCVDVTDAVRSAPRGRDALVAVRVDNSADPDIPPLSADFTFYGGLYRNVWLIATEPVHVTLLDMASAGVYVDTVGATHESAPVHVRGTVVNDGLETADVTVRSTVRDAHGHHVTASQTRLRLRAGGSTEFHQRVRPIRRPHLWSTDDPYLYTVTTEVDDGRGHRDRVDSPLGVRWFAFDPEQGFLLNDRHTPLRGTNRHQDHVTKGNALTDNEHRRDLAAIKEMGANVVRLAHYPQAPAVLDAADRLGLVVWEEIPLVNAITMSEGFTDNSVQMCTEHVRQHYNHPSVVLWGYMNEIFLRPPSPEPAGYEQATVALARRLEATVRREDPTRVTTMAGHQSQRYNTSGIADVPMVFGWNLYQGWYGGTFDQFGPFLDAEHAAHPKRVLWVSEYGADSDSRLHAVTPQRMDQTVEWQQRYHESYLRQIAARPYLSGTTLWVQYDFGSESRTGSVPHVNQKGLVHADRTNKDVFYLYQAALSRQPVLHIASREWSRRTGTGEDTGPGAGPRSVVQPVTVYTNLSRVELLHEGRSLGTREPNDARTATWNVPFHDGRNELVARGRSSAGHRLEDRTTVHFMYQAPTLDDPSVPFRRLAVSAGSTAQYIAPDRFVWEADRTSTDGHWGAVGGTAKTMTDGWVNGSTEDPLYQTYRFGMSAYRFDVPDGRYRVDLRFMEPFWSAPGQRVFDVTAGDVVLARDLDLVASVGRRTAHHVTGVVPVTGGAGLTVSFAASADAPVVSGLDIERL